MIHDYFGVDHEIISSIVNFDIPILKKQIAKIIKN
ncbi:MAG TPA: hypothetical protein DIV86_00255 [Alphaproteobacteria bacterium]|nr:hypothetical protein [Alphaproteobacteria bacterium]